VLPIVEDAPPHPASAIVALSRLPSQPPANLNGGVLALIHLSLLFAWLGADRFETAVRYESSKIVDDDQFIADWKPRLKRMKLKALEL
jgi:hypothetical protein